MLRTALSIVAALLCAGGVFVDATGRPGGTPIALWGAGVLAAILFERWRYRQAPKLSDDDWVRTDERFVDPETGKTLQVWYDPRTGRRSYIDAAQTRCDD
jgi:hypothetical protein